jgi:hypothetical protein
MPLRAQVLGKISAIAAASYSAGVANTVAIKLWPTDLPQGIFCSTFKKEMQLIFKEKHKTLGAIVN